MKNETSFPNYYKLLDNKKKAELRKVFLAASDLAYPTFYAKLRKSNFSKLELEKLSEICKVTFIKDPEKE